MQPSKMNVYASFCMNKILREDLEKALAQDKIVLVLDIFKLQEQFCKDIYSLEKFQTFDLGLYETASIVVSILDHVLNKQEDVDNFFVVPVSESLSKMFVNKTDGSVVCFENESTLKNVLAFIGQYNDKNKV